MFKILDGKALASKIRQNIKEEVNKLTELDLTPTLAVIQIGDDKASSIYVKNKSKACEEVGINFLDYKFVKDTSYKTLSMLISDLNNEFNYQIELRLTHWDETKARTFIWQDNKKTFMKKVDSESYNLNNESNIIVERLNRNILCNMKGLIGRNQGLINFGEMAMLVNWFYIKNNKKKGSSNAIQLEAVKELTDNINILKHICE